MNLARSDGSADHPTTPRERAPLSERPSAIGTIVAETYELTGVLGLGGMGVVYDAIDATLQRRVAIKLARSGIEAQALRKEGHALAAIRHPGIPLVHAAGRHESSSFLVLEALNGVTLAERIAEAGVKGPLAIEEVVAIVRGVADALSAVHAAGIIHRDVKSSNVMLSGSRVVLFDFGVMLPEVEVARNKLVAGTAYTMAPEQISNTVRPGEGSRVDLYALGVLAFEALTLRPPYGGEDADGIMASHLLAKVPDPRELRPDTPAPLAELVIELMAKEPRARPESAEVVVWKLDEIRASMAAKSWRVAIVDDDPAVGTALRRSLESAFPRLGVDVYVDPVDALTAITKSPPSLVLADLNMPRMNGIELAMRILDMPTSTRPTVVAISSEATASDELVLRSLHVDTLVPKDESFIERVSAVVGEMRRR